MKKHICSLLAITGVLFSAVTAFADTPDPPAVPEPGTIGLIVAGAIGLIAYKNIKK